jgi:hypothetical protein
MSRQHKINYLSKRFQNSIGYDRADMCYNMIRYQEFIPHLDHILKCISPDFMNMAIMRILDGWEDWWVLDGNGFDPIRYQVAKQIIVYQDLFDEEDIERFRKYME